MQSQRVLRQLEIAEEIQETGRAILRHLSGVLTGDEDKVGEHVKRLIAICPDGEKMATWSSRPPRRSIAQSSSSAARLGWT